jgi:tRNA acetyltransferase TAN1
LQYAVLYEARSNTGIDRMNIINAVAKCVPQPHKVDLNKPDKTIVVQIAKVKVLIHNTIRIIQFSLFLVVGAMEAFLCEWRTSLKETAF